MGIWEFDFIVWFQSLGGGFLDAFQNAMSFLGEEAVIILIIGFIYWGFDKEHGRLLGLMLFTSVSIGGIIKNIVKRPRPYESDYLIKNKRPTSDYSFAYPSGHAQLSATVYPSVALKYRKKWIIALAWIVPFLVAQSRVYLGMHFLSDVVGGIAFGLLILILINYLYNKIKNRYIFYLILVAASSAGLIFSQTSDYFKSFGMLVGSICGIIFEQRFVRFSPTQLWWRIVIRLAVGLLVLAAIAYGLDELFSLIIFESVWLNNMLDCLRYGVIVFVGFGAYPYLFKFEEKLFRKYESERDCLIKTSK